MGRLPVLFAIMICCHSAAADDPASNPSSANDEIARLLERIERLEKRVQELKGQSRSTPGATEAPQNRPYVPPYNSPQYPPYNTQPSIPITIPTQPQPYPPNSRPPIKHIPSARPNATVPKSWQPFKFNGQMFYIVPCDEASCLGEKEQTGKHTETIRRITPSS